MFNRNSFIKQLDDMFESQLKNILSEEEQNFINIKNKMNNDVFIIEKKVLKNADSEFLTKVNLKNKKKINDALQEKGDSVIVIYNERKTPLLVDGRWDGADTQYIKINNKNYIKVIKENKCGIINENGRVIIKPAYFDITESINNKYLWASKQNDEYTYCVLSLQDNILSPENLFCSGKKIIVNENNEELLFGKTLLGESLYNITKQEYIIKEGLYKKIKIDEKSNLFVVKDDNNKFGVIKDNKKIIENNYEFINIFNNLIQVTENKKIGIFDMNGKCITPTEYDKIHKILESEIILIKNNIKESIKI